MCSIWTWKFNSVNCSRQFSGFYYDKEAIWHFKTLFSSVYKKIRILTLNFSDSNCFGNLYQFYILEKNPITHACLCRYIASLLLSKIHTLNHKKWLTFSFSPPPSDFMNFFFLNNENEKSFFYQKKESVNKHGGSAFISRIILCYFYKSDCTWNAHKFCCEQQK